MKEELNNVTFTELCEALKQRGYEELAKKLSTIPQCDVTNEANIGQLLTNLQNYVCRSIPVENIHMLSRCEEGGNQTTAVLIVNLAKQGDARFCFLIEQERSYDRTNDGEWKYSLVFLFAPDFGKENISYTAVALEWY